MPTKSLIDQMVHTFGIVNVIIIFTIIPSNIASSAVLPVNTDKNYIRTQNLGSLLMKLSQSNFNLQSPDYYLVCSYQIATVYRSIFTPSEKLCMKWQK